jgi:methylenetetrahydrofolate--tRNA-(uracil-5-)-methyltransferase
MNKDEYIKFYNALVNADVAILKDFEKKSVFEGCMPVEVLAKRGENALRFGPLKPVGITNPITKEKVLCDCAT